MALERLLGRACLRLVKVGRSFRSNHYNSTFPICMAHSRQYHGIAHPIGLLHTHSSATLVLSGSARKVSAKDEKRNISKPHLKGDVNDNAKGESGGGPGPNDEDDKDNKEKHDYSIFGVLASMGLTEWLNPVTFLSKVNMAVVLHILRDWEPEFDPDDFLEGARHAIYVVTDLFSAKDAESMKRIMSPKMQAACAEVLAVYEDQQKPFSIELLEVKSCKLVKAVLWDDEDGRSCVQLVVSYIVRERFNTADSVTTFEGWIDRPYLYTFERPINKLHADDEKRGEFDYRWRISSIL